MLYVLLVLATLLTSLISGVLSMAGGMILMGIFSLFLSIPSAMVLHGVAQTVSNGSRIWLYRHHVRWSILTPYGIGALLVLGVFSSISFVPDPALVFLLIGTFPFVTLWLPANLQFNIERPATAVGCGMLVTGTQLLAGASGPVLDIFYVNSSLSRQEILGTKAITQTLGHILKSIYYALILDLTLDLPVWLYLVVVAAALGGNWLGSLIVARINDGQFKRVGRLVILVIGAVYIGRGLFSLW